MFKSIWHEIAKRTLSSVSDITAQLTVQTKYDMCMYLLIYVGYVHVPYIEQNRPRAVAFIIICSCTAAIAIASAASTAPLPAYNALPLGPHDKQWSFNLS